MRPKLWHHILTALGALLLLGATIFTAIRYPSLPAQIATGFDGAGLPSEYGGKASLLSLLGIAWVSYILITVLSFFPQTWNLPGMRIGGFRGARPPQNPRALAAMADMLAVTRPLFAFVFAWLSLCEVLGRNLGAWFLPVTMGALGLNFVIGFMRAARAK